MSSTGKLLLGVSLDEPLVPDREVLLRVLDEEVAALREVRG